MKKFKSVFFSHHDPALLPVFRKAIIGIAGAGGIGSNVALSLARVGIGKLIIADYDNVEVTNLNRQQYFIKQIGEPKVEALKENLEKINPFSEYIIHNVRLNAGNLLKIFKKVDILIEAFDKAESKQMMIEIWTENFPLKPLIVASGVAGIGKNDLIRTQQIDSLFIVGDQISEVKEKISPLAPRVGIVANMQANLALELLVKKYG